MTSPAPIGSAALGAGVARATGSLAVVPTSRTGVTRRTELASFLRTRRERLRPEDHGLPPGGRRRTPGLRREEVAQLAGVGVTWYTWLEQGRDINVSTQVLDAVARTLGLDRVEHKHLYTLAGIPAAKAAPEHSTLPPQTDRILRQLSPYPASVLNKRYDVLAYNDAFGRAIVDLDEIAEEDRNLLWLAFTYPDWKGAFVGSEDVCARLVAGYRAAMAEHLGEPAWQELTTRLLAASPAFAELWDRHDVGGPSDRVKLVVSPKVGLLRLEPTNLWVAQHAMARLIVYSPADDQTEQRLRRLVG